MEVAWPNYFTNSPVYKDVQAGDTITIHKHNQNPNNLIYQGVVAKGVTKLCLTSIFQQFIEPVDYEHYFLRFGWSVVLPTIFYVSDGKNTDKYTVWWNYADYNVGEDLGGNFGNLLDIGFGNVQDYYSPNLPIFIYSYTVGMYLDQGLNVLYSTTFTNPDARVAYINKLSDNIKFNPSLNIILITDHFESRERESVVLHPLPCWEGYTHCLYFLKRNGSIGWVFCKGVNSEKLNAEKSQITISDSFSNPSIENYQVQHYRSWKFNTGFITTQQANKLADLFISPRVWLFEIEGDMIGKVIVTDKTFEKKDKRAFEAPISYTINVRESETKSIIVP